MIPTKEETFNANILSNIGNILSGPVDLRGSNEDFDVGHFVVEGVYGRGDIGIMMTVVPTGEVISYAVRDLIVCGILDTVNAVGLSFGLIYMGKERLCVTAF